MLFANNDESHSFLVYLNYIYIYYNIMIVAIICNLPLTFIVPANNWRSYHFTQQLEVLYFTQQLETLPFSGPSIISRREMIGPRVK